MANVVSITKKDIDDAHQRISQFVHLSPVFTCQALNEIAGRRLYFKAENLQKTGSFKARGALNAVLLAKENGIQGVVTVSSKQYSFCIFDVATDNAQ